ncbi:aminoglycoside phosphotransferase family protein [Actinotalea ferrariae]|uniref:aminoglycoside phosphotransferase family protein n=1 Tax=Actinotalea ferrariae TaxID=1386098 RepID=UPI001C8CCCF1|nr:aminoglycoside phosphotransferase family protein [Actinotalea ferrariae]MBX9245434.1 aminoglycoside phosphotransferase family protein [Actinotalea ferrariae]
MTASAPADPPPRVVTLVLCRPDGVVLGALPPFPVAVPWWNEAASVVDGARAHHGVDVTVLRLIAGGSPDAVGGPVTYLAEVRDAEGRDPHPRLTAWTTPLDPHPLRLPYAAPGGPSADLAWADAALADLGRPRTGPPRQVRTWNLSSLWRLPTAEGAAWLKVVPPFFAHEGAVLARLDPAVVPPLLATSGPRVLLDEVAGEDLYGATGPVLLRMVSLLVDLQARWVERTDELLGLGAPDWRPGALAESAAATIGRTAAQLDRATRQACERLVQGLPERFRAIEACGVPDSLVHGDFHPGNLRGDGSHLVLLDWGDCGVGHPLLDRAAFFERLPAADRAAVADHWDALWRARVPGCDPSAAATLLAPVTALRQAVIYDAFLGAIEPSERVYHAQDPARWLTVAAEAH